MNWYSLAKKAVLEEAWWDRFYEHLSQNAGFLFAENDMRLIPTPVGKIFYSGVDGRKVFFAFSVLYKNIQYNCGINMEFDFQSGLPPGILGWQNSNLVEMKTRQNNINMIKGNWYVAAVEASDGDYSLVGRGFFLPNNSAPNKIMNSIKNSILKDGNDDDDNGEVDQPLPTVPSMNKPLVPQMA